MENLHTKMGPMLVEATEILTAAMPFHGPPTESPEGLQRLRVPRGRNGVCPQCGGPITRVPVRGRSTYYCQACQGT